MSDTTREAGTTSQEWRGDFKAAEERRLDASLSASASQRLEWLEQALAFAAKFGGLADRDKERNRAARDRNA